MEETSAMGLTAATLTDYHFDDRESDICQQRSFNALLKPFLSSLKKLPHGFTRGLCVSLLFSEYGASGFKIHVKSFYRLFARFRKNK